VDVSTELKRVFPIRSHETVANQLIQLDRKVELLQNSAACRASSNVPGSKRARKDGTWPSCSTSEKGGPLKNVKVPPSLILTAFGGWITAAKDVRMHSAKSDVETKRKESK
jgi:hypothetical protein